MVLLHELAHIKRNDFLINLLQSTLEVIFFFNPAVWWISREIRQERENCCDDLIVKMKGEPVQYIKTLAAVNHFNASGFTLLPGFFGNNKGQLLKRMQRLVGVKARNYSPQGYRVVSLLVLLLSFFYFGWINKDLSPSSPADVNDPVNSTLLAHFPALSQEPYTVLPVPEVDTVKEDIMKDQEAKIKEQEEVIKELKDKIEAMEARTREGKVEKKERMEELGKRSKELQRRAEEMRAQAERRVDKLQEIEIERMEEISKIIEENVIKELPDLDQLDYLNNHIELDIQQHLEIINEEVLENLKEIQISGLDEMKLNKEWMKEIMQMQELELGKMRIDLEEALSSMKDGLRIFTERIDRFKERLAVSLQEDGIITDETRKVRIAKRDGRIVINGEKLLEKLSQKYKTMLEEEFGDYHWANDDDDDFSFQFHLE